MEPAVDFFLRAAAHRFHLRRQRVVGQERVQNHAVEHGAREFETLGAEATEEDGNVLLEPVGQVHVGHFAERSRIAPHPFTAP